MAAQPECMRCGMYVHYGDVMCDECARTLQEANERLNAENERLRKVIQRIADLKAPGFPASLWARDALKAENHEVTP